MKVIPSNHSNVLEAFGAFKPFHTMFHHYVDLDCFLIRGSGPRDWWSLNRRIRRTSLYELEKKYRRLPQRARFLETCFRRARIGNRSYTGSYLGFRDLVVPVSRGNEPQTFLMSGAFADHEITAEEIRSCWKVMTGLEVPGFHGAFQEFAQTLLEIPVLDGMLMESYREAMELFARILAGDPDLESIQDRLLQILYKVISKRFPHSFFMSWALAQPAPESLPAWSAHIGRWGWVRNEIGLTRVPTTVVTVIPRWSPGKPRDPLETAIRVRRFQNRCFRFARTLSETMGDKLENYGAVFVTSADPSKSRIQRRDQLSEVVARIRKFASQELGEPVLVGIGGTVAPGEPLGESYRQAVLALHLERKSSREDVLPPKTTALPLGGMSEINHLLLELIRRFREHAFTDLEILRDDFLHRVLYFSLQNPDEIRWHLQYALLLLVDVARERADLREKEVDEFYDSLAARLERAATTQDIVVEFKETLGSLANLMGQGRSFAATQSFEKVREYIDFHFKERLGIRRLAEWTGVSPATFSRRFKAMTGTGLEKHLQKLRLEEAKRLLRTGSLPVFQVSLDCGFKSRTYFANLFKKKTGMTPAKYRSKSA